MGEKDRFEISAMKAKEVHAAAMLVSGDEPEKGGREIVEVAMAAMADHVCRDGHRYHELAGGSRLYCRRCGTVKAIDSEGDRADG